MVQNGVWDPKWVIFGPPSETPLFNSIRGFSCVLAQNGSKRGQKGVKKWSKRVILDPFWVHFGSQRDIWGHRTLFVHPGTGRGFETPWGPQNGSKMDKNG